MSVNQFLHVVVCINRSSRSTAAIHAKHSIHTPQREPKYTGKTLQPMSKLREKNMRKNNVVTVGKLTKYTKILPISAHYVGVLQKKL